MSANDARFINRELSWLEFNQRILSEAMDPHVPLLERLTFLSITASNLDEFFMVRVGALELLLRDGDTQPDPAGLTPEEQLLAVSERVRAMVRSQYACCRDLLEPALAAAGISRVRIDGVSPEQRSAVERLFDEEIFPVVTPMAVRSASEFPMLTNLGLNIAVRLEGAGKGRRPRFAVVPIGHRMERFVSVPSPSGFAYVLIDDIVASFADRLFPGETVVETIPFRITRNADMSLSEDQVADFLAQMEAVVDKRKQSGCVRLEIDHACSKTLLSFLRKALRVGERHVYKVDGLLGLSSYMALASVPGFEELRYRPWRPQPSPDVDPGKSLFEEISRHDILLAHPYDSFEPVVRFIKEAAEDPDVLAIKQTLYRTSSNSPVIAALRQAAANGKYVTALVELKARFDEERNIEWAKRLEQEGVQVIYGVKGLKTHSKICLVVRRESDGIVRYIHFGTGNYNERTARLYSDISYMTRDADLGADASAFFNAITGYSEVHEFTKLEMAPTGLRRKLLGLIEHEVERKRQGHDALIMAKMNSLSDTEMIEALYRASAQGVTIRLNIRGVCCLRPGVKGLSENISVISIVDRFLEHSRIFYFHQGGKPRVYISSADWMLRNLDRRVELFVPVGDPTCHRLTAILKTYFADTVKARRLRPNGTYARIPARRKGKPFRSQEALFEEACRNLEEARKAKRAVFEPHLPAGSAP